MTTNQLKSVEERVYLRWSNDWFITSHIIEASPGGDGVSYTATIPPQPDGNSCFYTVLTSTADLTEYTASGIIDDLTLALNGIFNALPTPPTVRQLRQLLRQPLQRRLQHRPRYRRRLRLSLQTRRLP